MKPIVYVVSLTLLSLLFVSCDKEEEDFISEPNATSTIITGRICTPEGTPFAGIPVLVDYYETGMLSHVSRHKAKGMTDENGNYRIFFNISTEEQESGALHFYVDFTELSTKDYLFPFEDSKIELIFKGENKVGETLECNFAIPRKKEIQVSISNAGTDFEEGEYAIAQTCSYGDGWQSISNPVFSYVNSDVTNYIPVKMPSSGSSVVTIPCAVGATNQLQLVHRKKALDDYETIGEIQEIDGSDISGDDIEFMYLPSVYKFKLEMEGQPKALYGGEFKNGAPFDLISFRIVDGNGVYAPGLMAPDFVQPYDSIVWSAKGLPDTYKIYNRFVEDGYSGDKMVHEISTCFYHPGVIANYYKGYRNGRVIHCDSVVIDIRNRDFLCFNWHNWTEIELTEDVHCAYNGLDRKYKYSFTNPFFPDKEVCWTSISAKSPLNTVSLTPEESLAGLLSLLENAGVEKVDIDLSAAANLFSTLTGDGEPVGFYENESTRVLLLHNVDDDWDLDSYSLHVEAK